MYIPVPISERLKLKYTNTHNNSLSCPSVLVEDQKQFFCAKAMAMWIFTFTGIYNWTALGSLAIFGNVIKSFEININFKGWGWPRCWSFRMQLLLTNSFDNSDKWRSTSHHKCHWNRKHSVHSFAFFDKLRILTRTT